MAEIRRVAVIDIGKSNAKLALVDLESAAEIAVRKTPNRPLADGPYPHHDVDRIWAFILESLAALDREHGVDAVVATTHGATCALIGADGGLALPVLDYEHGGPDTLRAEYDAVRPPFAESGAPALSLGLKLGAQLFWQARTFPDRFANVASVLMYPQYWAWRLCGVAANEVTSLGAHSDLWAPYRRDYASLVDRMGWRALMAPLRSAHDRLGPILPEVARQTGLDPRTPVFCGIHDSNASLLPHLETRKAPFSVVSTGTWVITMAIGEKTPTLDPHRDTLINVNAFGQPVPSARFMGGREYEMLTGGAEECWSEEDVAAVLAGRLMLLPSVLQGSGPFPASRHRWTGSRKPSPGERTVAIAFYLALMTATCLELVGAEGDTILEGPFARNPPYIRMLATATGRPVLPQAGHGTGTSIGAARLTGGIGGRPGPGGSAPRTAPETAMRSYVEAWREAFRNA